MTVSRDVVVTGTGVLCSVAADTPALAAALRAGVCGVGLRPETGDGGRHGMRPRLSADLPGFDLRAAVAARRGLPERLRALAVRVAGRAPLAVQAAVAVALEGWESAGLHRSTVPADRVGIVVAGHNLGGRYAEEVRDRYVASPVHLPARYPLWYMDTDHVGTVSEVLGITGEGYTVGGASASGNVAIINGHRLVAAADLDVCLVLGALTDLSAMELQGFFNLGAMAGVHGVGDPHRRCRPFDADREGFVPGQGAACLVLESTGSAARRRVPVLARVLGHALRLDGNSLADPSVRGESWVMSRAIERAGLSPDQIGYVNAHGTGSAKGDEVEISALREVFPPATPGPWVNSTKGLIGHCLCAAGVVEAVASVVQMREGFVHPNANLRRPIDPARRLVGERAVPARFDYAMSNGFGFGGFNTSVVFGQPIPG
jgi:malonyl-ACP decarboxylase